MITKRKTDSAQLKSKEKSKVPKQPKQIKKTKKQQGQKMQTCASKKNLKMGHQFKQHYDHNQHPIQNQNQNKSNLQTHYLLLPHKIKNYVQIEGNAQCPVIPMRRSASAGGIKPVKQVRKSLSPALSKQTKDKSDIKHKYSSKPTSRSQKQKIKQQAFLNQKLKILHIKKNEQGNQKHQIVRKKSQKLIKTHNQHQRLRTQNSSKVAEGSKQTERKTDKPVKKKKTDQSKQLTKIKVSSKNLSTKSKIKNPKLKQKIRNSIIFSDVSERDVSPLESAIITKQNFLVKLDNEQQNQQRKIVNACIIIQRHFRGYLTRKIIQQQKYMVCCAIKIQKAWRDYASYKMMKKEATFKKNLSIDNSLVTIKDFSDEPKQQKLKNKTFNFNFQQDSKKKQSNSSLKKSNNNEQYKYRFILQTLLEQDQLQEFIKQKIRKTLGRQEYVKNKIKSQIFSQRSFNSPRELRSPKGNVIINSPSSWSKTKHNEPIIQHYCASPRHTEVVQAVSKRVNSPSNNKSASSSSKRFNTEIKTQNKQQIKPIQTSFQFIEQFELRIVDFLRDNSQAKQLFLHLCKKSQNFRTFYILDNWKTTHKYNWLHPLSCPQIFPISLREQIINENSMKIYLEDNNYQQSLWASNKAQRQVYESYVKCIFDGLTEAIYENYKTQIITKSPQGIICNYGGHDLFKIIFMNSLTLVQGWCDYMCGAEVPVPETDPNFKQYSDKNLERIDIMVRNQVISANLFDDNSWELWANLHLEQDILQILLNEVYNQFFI